MCPFHRPVLPTHLSRWETRTKDIHETNVRQPRLVLSVSVRLLFPKMGVEMSFKMQSPVAVPKPRAAVILNMENDNQERTIQLVSS